MREAGATEVVEDFFGQGPETFLSRRRVKLINFPFTER